MQSIITMPKSTCPYVAIPRPGKLPFVFDRKKFTAVLRGIKITDWSLSDCGEWLEVVHSTGRVTGRYKFRNVLATNNGCQVKQNIRSWRVAESRRQKAVPVKGMPKAAQLEIRKCERELAKYYNRPYPAPKHPFVDCNKDAYSALEWDKQKTDRKKLAAIAGQVITRKVTEGTAYKQIRALGYPLTIQSKLHKQQQTLAADIGYWQHVYLFSGLIRASKWDRKPVDELAECKHHYSRRLDWLNHKREREELVSRIAASKAIHTPVTGTYAN